MENSGILKRRWSPLRKAQLISAIVAVFLTTAFVVFDALQIELPRGPLRENVFDIGILLMLPTHKLTSALGIENSIGYWGFRIFSVFLNAIIAVCIVSLIGLLISVVKSSANRKGKGVAH